MIVAETLNYRRAAEQLYISQPALSRKIAAVEQKLGIPLLNRTTRSVTLTQAGTACLEDVRRLVADYEALQRKADGVRHGIEGTLDVYYHDRVGIPFTAAICEILGKTFPRIKVEVTQQSAGSVCNALMRGKADLIVTMRVIGEKLKDTEYVVMHKQTPSVLIHAEHPLAKHSALSVEMLRDEPIIMHHNNRSNEVDDALIDMFVQAGFHPNIVLRAGETAEISVGRGQGILVMPIEARREYNYHENIKCLPLTGRYPQFDIVMAWRENCENPAVKLAVNTLKERYADTADALT
jgi:DNA-binding transcriptional LysR family regulator